GTAAGFLLLVVPGVILYLRWFVVAQSAALEGGSWVDALRRSHELTQRNYLHIIGLWLLVGLISLVPGFIVSRGFDHSHTDAVSFIVGVAVAILVRSFTALSTALLYFDLKARRQTARVASDAVPPPPPEYKVPPKGHPLDPASWNDEDRPRGWYVDPDAPWRMRHWAADGTGAWSRRTAKTPKATLAEWKNLRWVREN